MSFKDRIDAGERLADALERLRGEDVVVIALPRGGVEVALPVARRLGAPMTLLMVRKIGLPGQPELAMGAIVDGDKPITVRNESVIGFSGVGQAEFDAVVARELAEIHRREALYLGGRRPVPIEGRVAIVVDDGIATGATVRAALKGLKARKPARIVLAVPVASEDALDMLKDDADEVVALEGLSALGAIGFSYRDFPQLSDADVTAALDAAEPPGQNS
ncbi:MAG: phosphoribosyltransferase [Arenimonas sp.]|nr:phosphoribosyltransferase [Rhizobium sp.]MBW8445074.1 phosphoribosyltransferase [Arenimonas sp.]